MVTSAVSNGEMLNAVPVFRGLSCRTSGGDYDQNAETNSDAPRRSLEVGLAAAIG